MKKISLFIFLSLAITPQLYSQITFLPKLGVSYSHVTYPSDFPDPEEDYKSKIGLILGVAAEIPLIGEMLSVQPELLFHQKGFKYKYLDDTWKDDYNYTLNYLELPILAKVNFGKFYAEAGPSFAYGIGGKYKGTTSYMGDEETYDGKIKFGSEPANSDPDDHYVDNALDICVQIGVGVKVSVIVIDLRYGMGLTNIYDEFGSYESLKSKNGSLQLTVGYPIGGKK